MITIKGNPISINGLYKGRRFLTSQGKAIKEDYGWQIKQQWRRKPLVGSIKLTVRAYFGTKRARDLDNILKALQDAITGIAITDDSQIDEINIKRCYDKDNPHMELDLEVINY